MYNHADLKLELAALGNAGKPLPPGLYVLRLCAQSNNQVRRSLQLLGLDEDSLDMEVDIPVLVTDLQIHCSDKGVLITRYSTGKAANDVTLTQLARKMVHSMPGRETEWDSKTVELPHGVAYVKAINQRFVAMQGMDVEENTVYASVLDNAGYNVCIGKYNDTEKICTVIEWREVNKWKVEDGKIVEV
jgi:hypothetical protein